MEVNTDGHEGHRKKRYYRRYYSFCEFCVGATRHDSSLSKCPGQK